MKSVKLIEEHKPYIFSPTSKGVVIDSGEGCFLRDVDGHKYLDLAAGVWCSILGHSNKDLNDAIIHQTKKIIHLGYGFWSTSVFEAIKQIVSITPKNLSKVLLLCTGSEATEFALKIAKIYTDKFEVVGIERGYYGATQAALSVSDRRMAFPRTPGSHKILAPYCYRCPVKQEYPGCDFLCLEVSQKLIESNTTGKIAAFIFEPVFGSTIIVPPKDYFKRLKELADEYDALLIDDEVTTGIGRTGEWFGFQHYGIEPDILFMSKTLGAGFPVAAVVTTPEIEEECQKKKMVHVQSHMFDPLPPAAAEIVIKTVKEEKLLERSKKQGTYFLKRLNELKENYEVIGDVRGKGLMIGIELVDPKTKSLNLELGVKIESDLLKKGIIMPFSSLTSVFRLYPPLIIETQEIDQAIEKFDETLRKNSKIK
ncbi:MAG: aspartate aminotransferase family protein [Promethearchaeota archaeon]